ncbi:hypothetical protein SGUI_2064 [Serinicoccus hydrothermalis]|uniref:Uncharacterized protein n=1 Tax=Serinicoccus hydrothermalis TaxID=1758689 RepID=A0A1B1NDD0_9MICO|nr:DUF2786 domain-containing protein [Serinicoccus hydrothermalis]ANS79460.1 hypothetical protein SGUI_2064 [Serinicoccus hydrothermalis]
MEGDWDTEGARARCAQLAEMLGELWRRGWEPADLHGWASRQRHGLFVAVLDDAMAADLAAHARVTVEERWFDQLAEIGAGVWWDRGTDHLSARARDDPGGWVVVDRTATVLLQLLRLLPALEQIAAPPGEAREQATSASDVDQKLLTKVRLLLAKAESTDFEEEADTFTAAAQKLMARHSIDRAMMDAAERVEERAQGRGGPTATRLGVDRPYDRPKFVLLASIAEANRCRAVWNQGIGRATVVGFPVDLRAVELLYASLLVQATSAMQAEGPRRSAHGGSRTRSFRSSFLTGFAYRVGERLEQAAEEEKGEAAGSLESHVTGTSRDGDTGARPGVALVLARRERKVDAAVTERFPHLGTVRSRATWDGEGYRSGRAAAERAHLGDRGRLA